MSRRRTILAHMWHSVVRAPSASSCGVMPESRAEALGTSGSPSWGTRRWQKRQRMSFAGQVDVRWWAREVIVEKVSVVLHSVQRRIEGGWKRWLCFDCARVVLPWAES